jgi:hypothetical protein
MNGIRANDKDMPANDAPFYESNNAYIPDTVGNAINFVLKNQ